MESLLQMFRTTAGKLRTNLASTREKLEAARRRREELLTLPLPANDLVALMGEILDKRAAAYEEHFLRNFAGYVRNPRFDPASGPALQGSLVIWGLPSSGFPTATALEWAFAYFCKDQVMARVVAAADKSCTKGGLTRAERRVQLTKLEAEIADLERQEKEMVSDLEAIRSETYT